MKKQKFTRGGNWEMVKDLKGYPSHEKGGVDISITPNGIMFSKNNSKIKAEYGLVLSGGDPEKEKSTIYVDPNNPIGKERYQAYQDSLDLYNYNQLQRRLEPEDSQLKNLSLGLGFGKGEEYYNNQKKLLEIADLIIKNNPNITFGEMDFGKLKELDRENFIYGSGAVNSPDLIHKPKKIKPTGSWMGGALNYDYEEPKVKVEYLKKDKTVPPQPNEIKESKPEPKQPKKFIPNPEIIAKQEKLKEVGLYEGEIDGIWGEKSQAAWEEYQNKQNKIKEEPKKEKEPEKVIKQKPPLNEGEYRVSTNYPNVKVIRNKQKPLYYENRAGERIPFGSKFNREWQYRE